MFYGITAGHILAQGQYEEEKEDEDEFSDDKDEPFFDRDNFELDLSLDKNDPLGLADLTTETFKTADQAEQRVVCWSKIGHVTTTSHDTYTDAPSFD